MGPVPHTLTTNNGTATLRRGMMSITTRGPPGHNSGDVFNAAALSAHFRAFVRLMNQRLASSLRMYLAPRVNYNGRKVSCEAFAAQACPPGATLSSDMVVADVSKRMLAARIEVEVQNHTPCTPINYMNNHFGGALGVAGPGGAPLESPSSSATTSPGDESRRGSAHSVEYSREHVFYHFDDQWRIDEVWSVGEPRRPESPKQRPPTSTPRTAGRRMSIPSMFEDYRF